MALFILLKKLEVGARFTEPAKNVNVIAKPDLSGRGNFITNGIASSPYFSQ